MTRQIFVEGREYQTGQIPPCGFAGNSRFVLGATVTAFWLLAGFQSVSAQDFMTSSEAIEMPASALEGDGSGGGQSTEEELPPGWRSIAMGQEVAGIGFLSGGGISIRGSQVPKLSVAQGEKIFLSPLSPNGRYAFVVDQNDQYSTGYMLDLEMRSGDSIDLQAPPNLQISWSPDSRYVFLAAYWEGSSDLWLLDLGLKQIKSVRPKNLLDSETFVPRFETFKWGEGARVSWLADVFCNGYEDGASCAEGAEDVPIRAVQIEADASRGVILSQAPAPRSKILTSSGLLLQRVEK